MAIDFTLTPELEDIRTRVRTFIDTVVKPGEAQMGNRDDLDRGEYIKLIFEMRAKAQEEGRPPHGAHVHGAVGSTRGRRRPGGRRSASVPSVKTSRVLTRS